MKFYTTLFLLAVCVQSCFCYDLISPNKPLPKSVMSSSNQEEKEVLKHWAQKRQTGNNQIETVDECFAEISRLQCDTPDLFQDLTNAALSCSNTNTFEQIARSCARNSAGALCRNIPFNDTMLLPAQELCLPSGPPSETRTCSSECSNALQAVIDSIDCCINSFYNVTGSSVSLSLFEYEFWMDCGLDFLGECERETITPPQNIDDDCTPEEARIRTINALCTETFATVLEPLEDIAVCEPAIFTVATIGCSVNERGESCSQRTDLSPFFSAASTDCSINQTLCSDGCRSALETLRDILGCCTNVFFNTSVLFPEPQFFVNYALWEQCGVETPPRTCRNLLDEFDSTVGITTESEVTVGITTESEVTVGITTESEVTVGITTESEVTIGMTTEFGGAVGMTIALPCNSLFVKLLFMLVFLILGKMNV